MTNKEFIDALSQRTGFRQDLCQCMVQQVIDTMVSHFDQGESVQVPYFGTFEVKKRMERVIVNPVTKQRMLVPPKLVLGFRPSAGIKDKLKKGGEHEG